ncbi:MAG: hypothetical protein HY051_02595 [Candidatus Aenigmarchaeota archaeon]|nr:hypothetical protein [Candidatus Aenigmarchaeota archaeon]
METTQAKVRKRTFVHYQLTERGKRILEQLSRLEQRKPEGFNENRRFPCTEKPVGFLCRALRKPMFSQLENLWFSN